jgi:hypothetical protein
MAPHKLLDDDLFARARKLRAAGRSPKEIAVPWACDPAPWHR